MNGSTISKIALAAFAAVGLVSLSPSVAHASILYSEVVNPDPSALNAAVQQAILKLESGDDDLGEATATILDKMAPEQFQLTFYNVTSDLLGNAYKLQSLTDMPTTQPVEGLTIAAISNQTYYFDEAGPSFANIPTGSEGGSSNPVFSVSEVSNPGVPPLQVFSPVPLPGSVGMFGSALVALVGLSRLRKRVVIG